MQHRGTKIGVSDRFIEDLLGIEPQFSLIRNKFISNP